MTFVPASPRIRLATEVDAHVLHAVAVDGDDLVLRAEPGRLGRRAGDDRLDDQAAAAAGGLAEEDADAHDRAVEGVLLALHVGRRQERGVARVAQGIDQAADGPVGDGLLVHLGLVHVVLADEVHAPARRTRSWRAGRAAG